MEITIQQIDDKILELENESNETVESYIPADRGKTARLRLERLQKIKKDIQALKDVKILLLEGDSD